MHRKLYVPVEGDVTCLSTIVVIKSSEEAQIIIKALTSAAVQLNYTEIVRELGEAETIGSLLRGKFMNDYDP